MKWNLFKINDLALLLVSSFTMWLCSVLLFVPFKVPYNYENQLNTDQRSKTNKTNETNKKNEIACVTTCIRVPIESFSRNSI